MTIRARLARGTRTWLGLVTAAAVLPMGAAAPSEALAAEPAAAGERCALTEVLENPCRPLLGAESNHYLPGATFPDRIAEHEQRIGRPVDLVHIYVTDNPTMSRFEKQGASEPGRIPLVNWKVSSNWAAAADGSLDDEIDVMAADIKSIPNKVMFAVAHEPEDNVTPSGDPSCQASKANDLRGTATDYVNMWHRVRARFDAMGVDNVVWVMNYMGYVSYFGCAEALWPGNDYVDWVMWDPYPDLKTYTETVGGFYDHLTGANDAEHDFASKPWGLAEWGYRGTDQAAAYAMYAEARKTLHDNTFPKLKAYVIWDNLVVGGKDDRVGYTSSGTEDPEEQALYNAFANDPTFSPDTTAPTRPGALTASATGSSARLAWTGSTDAVRVAGYRVLRNNALVATLPADATRHTDTGLDDATSYSYTVVAFDPAGNTSAPATRTVRTRDVTAPKAPTSLRATLAGTAVRLTWARPSDNVSVRSYAVYRGGTRIGTPTATTLVDRAVRQGTRVSYTVRARDAVGNTSAPSRAVAIFVPDRTRPRKPALHASAAKRRVILTWRPASDNVRVARYWLYRENKRIAVLAPSARSYTHRGLKRRTRYHYRLVALDGAGNRSTGSRATARAR